MDPSQGDMSATNLRLLNELHPHQPQVALTYKLSIKTSDQPDIFFIFSQIFFFKFFYFTQFPPLKATWKSVRQGSFCPICLKKQNNNQKTNTNNFYKPLNVTQFYVPRGG